MLSIRDQLAETSKDVPANTMVTVPTAPASGPPGNSPKVAVPTVSRYLDPAFMTAALGSILALSEPVVQALQAAGPINWRSLVLGCILALVAYLRNSSNTVTK
jgi:hypothetical protein